MEKQIIDKTASLASYLQETEGFVVGDKTTYIDFYLFEMF